MWKHENTKHVEGHQKVCKQCKQCNQTCSQELLMHIAKEHYSWESTSDQEIYNNQPNNSETNANNGKEIHKSNDVMIVT